ncbi:MAG TPA: arsenate reductase ArsC [Methylophaga aminisulfidivorans]|uniref:arsenate reductase ArsC n=1 Tax=Methylophaga TaxID=40222 RepID=UPI001A149512|nr:MULTISPECIES: arsenate reductase ArsC [Methylophaga]HIM40160.1 arsenate reductase ArsC [Methylophaga aminisulfidivorans]
MKILFLCTHNRCRSILAEAVFNHLAAPQDKAFSAGSEPAGSVHLRTLELLHKKGISTEGLHSKSWDDVSQLKPDVVITVCDKAAGESCPLFFGQALKAHWGLPDPSQTSGTEEEIQVAFESVYQELFRRLGTLIGVLEQNPSADTIALTLRTLEKA